MDLNWSTFILEIINFLVLVWVLKHFFYKPVLDVIARRQTSIEKTLLDAKTLNDEATALKEQYNNRLNEWQKEREVALGKLHNEIEIERLHQTKELSLALKAEHEKAKLLEQRNLENTIADAEQSAVNHSLQFATRLLTTIAGPETNTKLLEMLLDQISTLAPEQLNTIRDNAKNLADGDVKVSSAYPIDDKLKRRLEKKLASDLSLTKAFSYQQEPALLAGVRISIGSWVLDANLKNELKGFAELAHEK